MEKLCARVRVEDATALEKLVRPVRERASVAVQDFLVLHSDPVPLPASAPTSLTPSYVSGTCHTDDDGDDETSCERQIQLPEIPPDQIAAESWENLEEVCKYKTLLYSRCVSVCFVFDSFYIVCGHKQ